MVHFGCSVQLTESRKKFGDIFWSYSSPSVTNFHLEALFSLQVSLLDLYHSFLRKLDRIFHQIDEDLLVSSLVANQENRLERVSLLDVSRVLHCIQVPSSNDDAFG